MGRPKKNPEPEVEEKDASTQLDDLLSSLDKKYGKGMVQYGAKIKKQHIERWKLESPNISYVLGGGVPKGRIMEIYGPESSGKTTVATFMAAQIQKEGGRVAVIDAEHAFDLDYARTLGLNTEEVIMSQPGSGEESLGIAEDMAKTGIVDFIIIDSVAALTPQAEIEGEMGDQQMGQQARLMGKSLRKISPVCGSTGTSIMFINQLREKIGVVYGNPETTPGGRALKYWSSIRLDVRRIEYLNEGQEIIGIKARVKGAKNKTAPPFRKAEIEIIFGKGIQYEQEYVDHAITYEFIEKSASWFNLYKDGEHLERIQGKEKVVNYLKENPEYFEYLKERVDNAIAGVKEEISYEEGMNNEEKEQETPNNNSD